MFRAKMINIGCGTTAHPDWINLDVAPAMPDVLAININEGLPFPSHFVDVCYSSHVLEHLDKICARSLIGECFRVLKHKGVLRLVLPDLEAIAREYLCILESLSSGDRIHELDYDWIMLEFYDQSVRNFSGGEMVKFLGGLEVKNQDFVLSRIGLEAAKFLKPKQSLSAWSRIIDFIKRTPWETLFKLFREKIAGCLVYLIAGKAAYSSYKIGIFRSSGEVHQWMYDRYSIKRLLEEAGFVNVTICAANESSIPDFGNYSLDVLNGVVRKPDSLFVEASKP